MSITYTWKLKSLKKCSTDTLSDAVIQTYWQYIGTNENGMQATFSGATPFPLTAVDAESFIPYSELTEETILGWIQNVVESNIGYKQHIEDEIARQMNVLVNPPQEITEIDFPWIPKAE